MPKVLPAAFIEEARDLIEIKKLEKQKATEERRRYQEQFEVNDEEPFNLIQLALDHKVSVQMRSLVHMANRQKDFHLRTAHKLSDQMQTITR
ncbi:hypothetical protein [Picosynechococcus sp. NKBG15041c]|uniref:hypothetical protein n=1 Tax=Picosynechococcus sp. NKBG15041c TaxID=1407650 RepID=UPI0004655132|nr:hypothetical protein [Picosynechococcus sp. NKBG15041c]